MSYLVLARKYRPQTFDQVVEQAHITRTLTNAISAGRVAHAILFSGPRGTGKTTVARILAKAMNCEKGPTPEPCNVCRSCTEITAGHAVDVFEIDGASNNSVDQIRELRENIKYMPAHSAFKIYIIDEVHMLSTAAFNALLKTLEEPPSHVMFMFATTEPHKIPITILSRCQRHDFRRIGLASISNHMARICAREGFEASEQSLGLIAREAGGSLRDALSLLDQIMTCAQGKIADEQVLDILGVIDRKMIYDLAGAILAADIPAVLDLVDEIYDRGHDMKTLYADLLEHFRNLLVAALCKKVDKLVDLPAGEIAQLIKQAELVSQGVLNQIFDLLFREELSIRLSPQPKLALEMALVRVLHAKPALPIDVLIDKLDDLRQEILPSSQHREIGAPSSMISDSEDAPSARPRVVPLSGEPKAEPIKTAPAAESVSAALESSGDPLEIWQQILRQVARDNPSLAANLSKCQIKKFADQTIEIEVPGNGFTFNMIQREKNMAALTRICETILGRHHAIKFTANSSLEDNKRKKKTNRRLKQKAMSHPIVADAIEIFDGKLVDVKIL